MTATDEEVRPPSAQKVSNALRSQPVMRTRRPLRTIGRVAGASALVVGAALAGISFSPSDDTSVEAATVGLGAGGEFHGLKPTRILDTRTAALDVAPRGKKPTGDLREFEVEVVGKGDLPDFTPGTANDDANVLAVVVNITVIKPTQSGYLQAFGTGAPAGTTSVVNFKAGDVVPNTALLRPGADGKLTIRLFSSVPGSAHVAIDLTGWFSSSNYVDADDSGARVIPTATPARVYDSNLSQFGGRPRGPNSWVAVDIQGASVVGGSGRVCSDPDVSGVVVNLTGVNRTSGGPATFVSALPARPAGNAVPGTSNLNLSPGDTRANMSIMPVGADGRIHLYNSVGQVRVVVDVVACLLTGQPESTKAGRVVPLISPFRAFDTRKDDFFDQPLGPASYEDWSFESFVDDVSVGGNWVGPQSGLIGNLTATGLQPRYVGTSVTSYITAFPTPPSGEGVPLVSNLNLGQGRAVPNMALLTYGERAGDDNCAGAHCVRFFNYDGYVDYILDVSAVILDEAG